MSVDWDKPVQTRDGRPVRILCRDMKGTRDSIVGLVDCGDGAEKLESWCESGRYYDDSEDGLDLVNVPKRRDGWINVFKSGLSSEIAIAPTHYPTLKEAQDHAEIDESTLIACVPFSFDEGQGL